MIVKFENFLLYSRHYQNYYPELEENAKNFTNFININRNSDELHS